MPTLHFYRIDPSGRDSMFRTPSGDPSPYPYTSAFASVQKKRDMIETTTIGKI